MSQSNKHPLKGRIILAVEDKSDNRVVLQLALAKSGARLRFNFRGTDLLTQLAEEGPFDMILMDLMLPGGRSGIDLAAEVKADPRFAHIPVVAVSAAEAHPNRQRAEAAGFVGFIAKPIDSEQFAQQLEAIFAGSDAVWA